MANKYFNKQVAESRKPYKHGSYVSAEPTKTPKIIEKKILDPRTRKQLEERFSKNKIKTKPESSIREKNQADYMKKHGKNEPRRKTLSVKNTYKKEVEGLKK